LYEQGIGHAWARTPLANGTSLAVHESQSRMWENLVGRSLPFWEHFYPELQATFPEQLGKVSLENFYKGINKVQPSYIRVEADEATYNLHIMLRLELEIAMIEGPGGQRLAGGLERQIPGLSWPDPAQQCPGRAPGYSLVGRHGWLFLNLRAR